MGIIQWMTDRADAAKATPTPPETHKNPELLPLLPVVKTAPATLEAAPLLAVAAVAVVASEKTKGERETENPAGNPAGGGVTETPKPTTPPAPLTAEHRAMITAWLDHIGEHDQEERNRVGHRCQTEPDALAYVMREATKAEITPPATTGQAEPDMITEAEGGALSMLAGLAMDKSDHLHVLSYTNAMPPDDRCRILAQYCHHWESARDREPNEAKRDNTGRRAANSWLRLQQMSAT